MKFLRKEETIAVLAFMFAVLIVGSIFYFAKEHAPKIETPEDNCEIGCPVHVPCHPDCKKEIK